jgi:hypothetical protein
MHHEQWDSCVDLQGTLMVHYIHVELWSFPFEYQCHIIISGVG